MEEFHWGATPDPLAPPLPPNLGVVLKHGLRRIGGCVGQLPTFLYNLLVAAVSCSCFFQLRQLRIIRDSLSLDAAKTLVNAFVGSRLDYCNSL